MIKSFIYLDEEKMYSLSSQLFEGITEYILDETESEAEKSENQKGPVGSGRILGDILKSTDRHSEKKFLNDYSYSLFEAELISRDKVCTIREGTPSSADQYTDKRFVKVTAKIIFNDVNSIRYTLNNFNELGECFAYVTNFAAISASEEQLQNNSMINQKGKKKQKRNQNVTLKNAAKEKGLFLDPNYLTKLETILDYGFQDQFEVQMSLGDLLVSSNLNRDFLRENESILTKKYGRKTEIDFTLFGIITQCIGENVIEHDVEIDEIETEKMVEHDNIKTAMMSLVQNLWAVESTFVGRIDNEMIVDPIAIYTEL
ncbi:MAG: hypothetical protein AB7E51_03615 [Pseudodesulfovibrio sp.]|uniref:DUF6414 family protein n=1 Tax=Pseudodesulfovibrio sp. TaxID=2035812 RepID=UPI003D140A03